MVRKIEVNIKESERERDTFEKDLKQIESEIARSESKDRAEERNAVEKLEREERDLWKKLEELTRTEEEYDSRLKQLAVEKEELSKIEEEYWRSVNTFEAKLLDFQEDTGRVESTLFDTHTHYEKLTKTNVLNDVFKISFIDEFGTISGFRLGKLILNDVPWDEINAALG